MKIGTLVTETKVTGIHVELTTEEVGALVMLANKLGGPVAHMSRIAHIGPGTLHLRKDDDGGGRSKTP
jgi:hypothetical protein